MIQAETYDGGIAQIHDTATVEGEYNTLSDGCKIWNYTQIRKGVLIGKDTIIGSHCYIDKGVEIGENCQIQNGVNIYYPAIIGDNVFIGPNVTFSNSRHPNTQNNRALLGQPFEPDGIYIEDGALIGVSATIMAPVVIGAGSFIGGGSVVMRDVLPHTLVYGVPAQYKGIVCGVCREPFYTTDPYIMVVNYDINRSGFECPHCGTKYRISHNLDGLWTNHYIIERV